MTCEAKVERLFPSFQYISNIRKTFQSSLKKKIQKWRNNNNEKIRNYENNTNTIVRKEKQIWCSRLPPSMSNEKARQHLTKEKIACINNQKPIYFPVKYRVNSQKNYIKLSLFRGVNGQKHLKLSPFQGVSHLNCQLFPFPAWTIIIYVLKHTSKLTDSSFFPCPTRTITIYSTRCVSIHRWW